jgi:lipoprotein-anchoring transpeptidase ErfK/SrfK
MQHSKRLFLAGAGSTAVTLITGCTTTGSAPDRNDSKTPSNRYASMYGPLPDEQFPIPAVNLKRVPERFLRRQVTFKSSYRPGTLVVNTRSFYLHLVQRNNEAMRYGVGLGRAGFEWSGSGVIQWKQRWPRWTPPSEMIEREPELAKWSAANGGMPPGLDNPLGARALYIFEAGEDTLYRLHGTPEYWTIGKAVSSGCVRLMNQDIIDLYDRVPSGARLIVT